MEDILDNEEESIKKLGFDFKEVLALLLAIFVSLISLIVSGLFVDVLIFFLGCLVCLVLAYFRKIIWRYLFLGLLTLSATSILSISNYEFKIGFNSLSLHFFPTLFIIIHFSLNHQKIIGKNGRGKGFVFKAFEKSKEQEVSEFENMVNRFMLKFKNKSKQDLQDVVDNPSMVSEAMEAAKRLLNK